MSSLVGINGDHGSTPGRTKISSVAVRRLNTTIQSMNNKLGALIPTNLSSSIYCLFFGGIVAAGALSSAPFYVPATVRIMNNMVRRTSHTITPCVPEDSRWRNHLH